MAKAKLIKRSEITKQVKSKKVRLTSKDNVQKTVNAVVEWIESKRIQSEDPRKAFAALFAQSQPQQP